MDAAEIARLREINEKATPGPWGGPNEDGIIAHWDGDADDQGRCIITKDEICTVADASDFEANAAYIAAFDPPTTRALLDALEQAQKEIAWHPANIDGMRRACEEDLSILRLQRDAAQQDAKDARAMLARAKHSISEQYTELHARIEAMLEKKL